jgi:hypothetical protein
MCIGLMFLPKQAGPSVTRHGWRNLGPSRGRHKPLISGKFQRFGERVCCGAVWNTARSSALGKGFALPLSGTVDELRLLQKKRHVASFGINFHRLRKGLRRLRWIRARSDPSCRRAATT